MIQLRCKKDGNFELTDRNRTVTLESGKIKLDNYTFEEPGEYEVDGIEVVYGSQAALLVWEKLQIAYLFGAAKPTGFEKSQFTPCNVLLMDSSVNGLDKQRANELLEAYDPSVVAFASGIELGDLQTALKIEDRDVLKIADSTLPVEGRELYRLTQ